MVKNIMQLTDTKIEKGRMPNGIQILGLYTHVTDFGKR